MLDKIYWCIQDEMYFLVVFFLFLSDSFIHVFICGPVLS
jgi:hypothetical protein